MTFALFDDNFAEHPKVVALSDGAFRLFASGILYCSRLRTDGRIPKAKVPGLVPEYRRAYLNELVRAGLWLPVGDVYDVHDYLAWNRSRAEIESERARKSKGGKLGAEKRWRAAAN